MEIKKLTEVVIVSGVLAVTMVSADAAGGSYGYSSVGNQQDVSSGAAGGYVQEAFKLSLSAWTSMEWDADTNTVGVNTASFRGMHTFGSSSAGVAAHACETTSVSAPTAKALTGATISTGC